MANFHCDISSRTSGPKVPQRWHGAAPVADGHHDSSRSNKGFAVSVVAAEGSSRDELAVQLEDHAYEVRTFATASALYREMAVRPHGAVILDVDLPDEDGFSVCRHLRSHDAQIGLVLAIASNLREQRLAGLAAGADAYLLKPLDVDELVLVLARLRSRIAASESAAAESSTLAPDAQAWELDARGGFLVAPNGRRKRISHSERLLLNVLVQEDRARSHLELAMALGLHPDDFDQHRIEVIVSRLRSSAYRETGIRLPLKTVRGFGYELPNVRLV